MSAVETCRFFLQGNCKRGDDCRFAHDTILDISQRPPCVFYARGYCKYGDDCQFRHDLEPDSSNSPPLGSTAAGTSEVMRTFNNVKATFGPGAEVLSVCLLESGVEDVSLQVPQLHLTWQKPGSWLEIRFRDLNYASEAAFRYRYCPRLADAKIFVPPVGLQHPVDQAWNVRVVLRKLPADFYDRDDVEEDVEMIRSIKREWGGQNEVFKTDEDTAAGVRRDIEQALSHCGEITFLDWSESSNGKRGFARVQYTNLAAVRQMQDRFQVLRFDNALNIPLTSKLMYRARAVIRAPIMDALEDEYEDLVEDAEANDVYTRRGQKDPIRGTYYIKFSSLDREELGRTKQAVQKLFAGVVAKAGDKILWHPYFSTGEGLKEINDIDRLTYIYRDLDAQCLRMYGPTDRVTHALAQITRRLEELQDHRVELVVKAAEFGANYNKIANYLMAEFGRAYVQLEVTWNSRQVKFRGSADQVKDIKVFLNKFERIAVPANEQMSSCPICWGEVESPVTLPCSHVYCKDCLSSQIDGEQFPIVCHGAVPHGEGNNTGACGQPVILDIIRNAAEVGEAYDQILRRALTTYLKSRPLDYRPCPTPDCAHWYAPITDPTYDRAAPQSEDDSLSIYICPSCYSSTCRVCSLPAHPESSCEQAVEWETNHDLSFTRWKRQNRVRNCPSCTVPIQKAGGCNHVTCVGCGTHICWFCMQTFAEPDVVYQHMQEEHNAEYVNEEEDESDDEEDENEEIADRQLGNRIAHPDFDDEDDEEEDPPEATVIPGGLNPEDYEEIVLNRDLMDWFGPPPLEDMETDTDDGWED